MKTPTEIDEKIKSYLDRAGKVVPLYMERHVSMDGLVEIAKMIQREELAEKKV